MVMATVVSEHVCVRTAHDSFNSKCQYALLRNKPHSNLLLYSSFRIRACQSMPNNKDVYKQISPKVAECLATAFHAVVKTTKTCGRDCSCGLQFTTMPTLKGLFSLRRKVEDAVHRAEMFASTALEMEEARRTQQEEMVRDFDLWDDPAKSNDILVKLANSAKLVDSLKDLRYKVEEAKLIQQLAEMNAIDYGLYKQAYDASLDAGKIQDQYEMCKLLKGPFDVAGACLVIKAGPGGIYPKLWAEQLLSMYLKWAKKQGYEGRIVDRCTFKNAGITSATLEFEFEYAYGYLSGEKGIHNLIRGSLNESSLEASLATVDVIPMFVDSAHDQDIDSEDLIISSPLIYGERKRQTDLTVCIQHVPTGISVQSSGERSHFANKTKAFNRLNAKLLVVAREQGVSSISSIRKDNIVNLLQEETRRYISNPYKLVHDVKTGIEVPDLNSVLDGNIEPLIAAHINTRVMS